MPALWSGSITFGLVSIPVKLEVSHRSKSLGFHLLHSKCRQRVKQRYHCPSCDEDIERRDLLRGYEFEKDRYVVMNPEDFQKAEGQASRNIEVFAFVARSEIKPAYLNRTYYLVPEEGAEKGYLLLLRGMQETDTLAITRFVMRGKEYIGAVAFGEQGLMLHILFHQGEFQQLEEVIQLPDIALKDKELQLATQIIENMTDEFSAEMLTDHHRERLLEVVRQKVDGEEVVVAESEQPARVVDLMEALKKSLQMTAQKKPAARAGTGLEANKKKRKRA